jgi:hypothetical protein
MWHNTWHWSQTISCPSAITLIPLWLSRSLPDVTPISCDDRAAAQALSGPSSISAACIRARIKSHGICGGQQHWVRLSLSVRTWVSPVNPPFHQSSSQSVIQEWYKGPVCGLRNSGCCWPCPDVNWQECVPHVTPMYDVWRHSVQIRRSSLFDTVHFIDQWFGRVECSFLLVLKTATVASRSRITEDFYEVWYWRP